MIHDSDVRVAPGIYVAYASRWGKKKQKALKLARMVKMAMPHFRKLLDLPDDLQIRIAGIKGRTQGRYFGDERVAVLDTDLSMSMQALEVLAHELVHAEQWKQKRLSHVLCNGRWTSLWNGRMGYPRGTTYAAYRAQPWEEEAFRRQVELAKAVSDMLDKDLE